MFHQVRGSALLAAAILSVAGPAHAALISVGASAPVPGPNDISQLTNTAAAGGGNVSDNLNYYTDNSTPPGQTFLTGSNALGYKVNSLALYVRDAGTTASGDQFTLDISSVNTITNQTVAVLDSETATVPSAPVASNYLTFTPSNAVVLLPNTTYAYDFRRSGANTHYLGLGIASGNLYPNGQAALVPTTAGGTLTYGTTGTWDGTFDLSLTAAPEPSSFGLVGIGAAIFLRRRRRA